MCLRGMRRKRRSFLRAHAAALRLIRTYDPPRFARITRDLRRILFVPGGGESYGEGTRTYLVNQPLVLTRPLEEVALPSCRSATPASMRSVSRPRSRRERIETMCVKEEIAFAARLPAGDWGKPSERKLDSPWWTGEETHRRKMASRSLRRATHHHTRAGLGLSATNDPAAGGFVTEFPRRRSLQRAFAPGGLT